MNILFCTFNKIVLEDGCCSLFYMFFRHHVTQLCIKGHKLSKQLIGKAPFPILITIRIHVVYNLLIKFAVPAYFSASPACPICSAISAAAVNAAK